MSFLPNTCTRSIGRKSLDVAKDSRLNNAKLLMLYLHHQCADSSTQTAAILSKLFSKTSKGQYWAYYPNVGNENVGLRSAQNDTYE